MRNSILVFLLLFSSYAKAQNLKSGGVLKPEQAIMDIRHYTVALEVNPTEKTINGYTEIDLNLLQPTNNLLFDFWHGLKISQLWVNGKTQNFTHTNDDYIKIPLSQQLPAGKVKVKVAYGGNPAVALRPPWTGGFQWAKDAKGNPWISVTCQMEGAKIYFPCKDHPSDEPNEGVDMIITVPKGLIATSPGILQTTTKANDKTTFHWKTNYTISNYCIVFNIGKYKLATRMYTTVNGNKVPIEYYVLEENFNKQNIFLMSMSNLVEYRKNILENILG